LCDGDAHTGVNHAGLQYFSGRIACYCVRLCAPGFRCPSVCRR